MKVKQKAKVQIPFSSHRLLLENFKIGGKYLIFEPVARGRHSVVYNGVEESSMEERALKFYNFREIEEFEGFRYKQICKRISKYEWAMMRECTCINILQPLDVYEDKDNKLIAYEFCESSLAADIEERSCKQISESKAILILKQILNALKTLHKRNRLHTRLQPKDILVKNGIYKLVDLGLPRLEADDKFPYYAPEILGKKYYDEKAQVWSIGILFHQILYGEPPAFYKYNSPSSLLQHSSRSIYEAYGSKVSEQAMSFLSGCLTVSPEERLCWEQLCNHQLFGNVELPKATVSKQSREERTQHREKRLSVVLPLEEVQEQEQVQMRPQRFNIDAEKMMIQKEIQKDYHKVGEPFELQPLERNSIEYLKGKINHQQKELYQKMRHYYLQCQKVQFVYYYIIKPLMKKSQKYTRPVIELLNLMAGSCFSAMSLVRFKRKDKAGYEGLIESCVSKETGRLYEVVKGTWQQLGDVLFKEQNKFFSIISDKLKKFQNQEQQRRKEVFLGGIENKDFQPGAKVEFTQQFARNIEPELEHLIAESKQKHPQDVEKIRKALGYLKAYTRIWGILVEHKVDENYPSLQYYIDKHIL